MHERTVAAVKKWLLYRPMTPAGDDILFSAKLTTSGHPDVDANRQFEVTHLTCFLGGMFALGGRAFGLSADLEIARRLTDGCVWAYGATPSGIMPEGSIVVPCADQAGCEWNETLWRQALDPQWEYREQQLADYYAHKEEVERHARIVAAQEEAERLREKAALDVGQEDVEGTPGVVSGESTREKTLYEVEGVAGEVSNAGSAPATSDPSYRYPRPEPASEAPAVAKRDVDPNWDYRQTTSEAPEDPPAEAVAAERAGVVQGTPTRPDPEAPFEPGVNAVGGEFGQIPLKDPKRPLTHDEYVDSRIKNEKIPRGFARVPSKRYILR